MEEKENTDVRVDSETGELVHVDKVNITMTLRQFEDAVDNARLDGQIQGIREGFDAKGNSINHFESCNHLGPCICFTDFESADDYLRFKGLI